MHADWLRLTLGLLLLSGISLGALSWLGVRLRSAVITASLRAVAQLGAIGLVLRGVFDAPAAVVAFLAVMLGTAVLTCWGRLGRRPGTLTAVVIALVTGAVPVVTIVLTVPLVPSGVRYVIAMGGILLGGAMTAVTLTGRSLHTGMVRRSEEIEGWLALGATPRRAVLAVARDAVVDGLVPGIDQTRTVGLVTLPGTFVGALLGGAGAQDAARFQIVVLVALIATQSLAAVALASLLGAPSTLPSVLPTERGG
jgi:putative ABC transport system permease protein